MLVGVKMLVDVKMQSEPFVRNEYLFAAVLGRVGSTRTFSYILKADLPGTLSGPFVSARLNYT